jgi:hypothetical protein
VQRCEYILRFGGARNIDYINAWAPCVSSLRKDARGAYVSRVSKGEFDLKNLQVELLNGWTDLCHIHQLAPGMHTDSRMQ